MIKINKTKKNDILSQNYKYKGNETKRARGIWAKQHQRQKIQRRGESWNICDSICIFNLTQKKVKKFSEEETVQVPYNDNDEDDDVTGAVPVSSCRHQSFVSYLHIILRLFNIIVTTIYFTTPNKAASSQRLPEFQTSSTHG